MSRRRATRIALAAAAVDAGAVTVFWRVHEARRVLVAQVRDNASAHLHEAWGHLEAEAKALLIGGGALLVLSLIAAIAGLRWARRRSTGALPAIAVVSPAIVLGCTGMALARGAWALLSYGEGCGDPEMMDRYRYETFASHAAPYQAARLAILAVALLSTAAVLLLARRARVAAPRRLFAPVAVFVVGLAAFALTRAEAADARSPMPLLPVTSRMWWGPSHVATIPTALGCEPGSGSGPTVELEGQKWVVDGVPTADPAELGRVLTGRREVWAQLTTKPFPGTVTVVSPADTPLSVVRPMLETVHAAGYPIVEVLEAFPVPSWPSRTLGSVPYTPRACRVRLAAGQEVPPVQTWGEMAHALAGAR